MSVIRKDGPTAGDVHVPGPDLKAPKRRVRGPGGEDLAKAAPAPLYVWRKLINAGEVIAWAKKQGFETTLPADEMHVTVLYSKMPVDWMEMGESWSGDKNGHITVQPGGPRIVSQFNEGAVVLEFACDTCEWRHRQMCEAGATHGFDSYKPHLTITYSAPEGFDLTKVEPYRGKLVFGPEIFEEIKGPYDPNNLIEKGEIQTFFKVSGVDEGLGLVFGWAIVCTEGGQPYYDVQKNHIPDEAMVEATTDFMKASREAGDMHARMDAGTVVHSFPLTAEIAKAMGITCARTGWMIAMAPDAAMLRKFASGEYTGFSIGGRHLELDGVPLAEAA